MSAAEDWAATRKLRAQPKEPQNELPKEPPKVKAKYRVRCKGCGVMMDWPCNDVCPACLKKMSAPVSSRHGQTVYGN